MGRVMRCLEDRQPLKGRGHEVVQYRQKGGNTGKILRFHEAAVPTRSSATDAIPDDMPPHDLPDHAPESDMRIRVTCIPDGHSSVCS